ncbi:MAG: N-acetylmuramoyl-L-alanine amidase [Eubacteriales bacterium]|nr:N-acetylmuramoyl-L-alanine amidase [Eubacteriales bacterium]
MTKKKVYLSPSNQTENRYAYGNTNEAVQCGKIAEACRVALVRSGVEVMVGHMPSMQQKCKESDAFKADLHVPIHTNACNGKVSGTRMFCYNKTGNGYKACRAIYNVLAPFTPGTSESITANGDELYEVRVPSAPTAYIEVDFHDVPSVAKWIIENTTNIGEKIAQGICNYLGVKFVAPAAPKPTSAPAATGSTIYRVQVGAYAVKANAEAMQKKLKVAGFDGIIVEGKK